MAGERIRHHILLNHAVGANKCVTANPAELMYTAVRTDVRPIFDGDVTGEPNAVSENHMIADRAIVGHMAVSHQQAIVANGCVESAPDSAPVYRDKLADRVAISNACERPLAPILQV